MHRVQIGFILTVVALAVALVAAAPTATEAPVGMTNTTNGLTDQPTFDADMARFSEIEGLPDGLGPLFNDSSCANCHKGAGAVGTALATTGMASLSLLTFNSPPAR